MDIGNSFFSIWKTNVTWAAFVPEKMRLLKFGVDTIKFGFAERQIEEGVGAASAKKNPPNLFGGFVSSHLDWLC
ncbi:hypothetical protein [Agrobacterium rosae]|uniref:hypothetical protein n=1 Tax=Agrobacterium rosae TaxID=1972867 RepID=UPI0011774706|nr:hypothetical protein [Agrobacterium rosae]